MATLEAKSEKITLEKILYLKNTKKRTKFSFVIVRSDNEPEFIKWLTAEKNRIDIDHSHTKTIKCNNNAHIERFNRNIEDMSNLE